jgi:acyl-CoA thioesterase FadM
MWVEELDGPKWALRGEFRIGEKLCAKVYHYGVWVDAKTFRPTDGPDDLPRVILQPRMK